MVILITYIDGEKQRIVSHGIDTLKDKVVVLPNLPLNYFDYHFDKELGELVLDTD